eukprot:TRINITY_DN25027_c0_g1_i4.p1 TRINITY_DN25027_c0_g1~~TRINITY_DN25027_c0_g1_i4.p1  ORF type:complete len:103 (+),score=22.83 TRINITY_DN25027_c0_g1_i4:45-353(+)
MTLLNRPYIFFFFKQKTAYEMLRSLVGSEMCIRDSIMGVPPLRAVHTSYIKMTPPAAAFDSHDSSRILKNGMRMWTSTGTAPITLEIWQHKKYAYHRAYTYI